MTTTTGTRTETRCLDCRVPCPQSIICRLHIDAPLQKVARLVADVLYRSGFEVVARTAAVRAQPSAFRKDV